MKISSTLPTPVSTLAGRNAAAPVQQSARAQGSGFLGAMQEGARNGYLEIPICDLFKPIIETETMRFMVETQIGDEAVRFDARPIVAPTASATDSSEGDPGTVLPVASLHEGTRPPTEDLVNLVSELAGRMPVIAREIGRVHQDAIRLRPASASESALPSRFGAQFGAATVAPAARRATSAATSTRPEAAAALRYVPDPTASASRTMTRVTALPRELFVILRGISLSAEDSAALSAKIRDVLDQYQLGDRMVKIVGTGNKS